ncbi:MAG: glutaredoxin domain-containing protein [bacterium]|nr:glutaredoxin domain-containing protein [bacterium]
MKPITIYTTPTCTYCRAAKEFFKEHGLEFQEKDVASDMAAREEMMTKTDMLAVPVIDVGGEVVIGFDRERLAELTGVKE